MDGWVYGQVGSKWTMVRGMDGWVDELMNGKGKEWEKK